MLTRRHFTRALAATAAAAPFTTAIARADAGPASTPAAGAGNAGRPASPAAMPDVLVIGAGLSGLEAALLLEEQGAKVQVIEGRRRIGGRVYTLFDRPGYPEVGGNSFAQGYGRVLDRVRKSGLGLQDTTPRRAKFPGLELALQGRLYKRAEWAQSPANPFRDKARERFPWEFGGAFLATNNPLKPGEDWLSDSSLAYDVALHDFMAAKGLDDRTINLCWSASPYFGSSAYDISALQCFFNDAWSRAVTQTSTATLSVKGGNQQLPLAMAKQLKHEIHLGREVVAIDETADGVEALCRDGSKYRARAVLCSVPFSVLRTVHVSPALEGPQAAAVHLLPYMINTLVFFVPRKPFWEQDGLNPSMWTDGPAGTVMAQRFGDRDEQVTAIVANPRGHMAAYLDRLPPKDAIRLVQQEIERLRPAAKGALENGTIHSWATDPFSAGDWAVFGPGHIRAFARQLAKPRGRVFFCGEHTAHANRGMEGALESAERAVLEIVEKLG